jgi:hypothetical protein
MLRNKTKYADRFLLSDTVRPIHRLKIGLRVPVTVVEDNDVRSGEIDAKPARTGGEEEDEFRRAGLVVRVDC